MTHNSFDHSVYLRDKVAREDPDRYLLTLLVPRDIRPKLWAVLAFNQDLAHVRMATREPTLGLMRLQWWRDTLASLSSGSLVKGHPVVEVLAPLIMGEQGRVVRAELDILIDAREFDVSGGDPPATLSGLESYIDFTNTGLVMLMAILQGKNLARERARYLGVAYGLTHLLRTLPDYIAQGWWLLPTENHDHQVIQYSVENISKPIYRDHLKKNVRFIAEMAMDHLTRATEINHVPSLRGQKALTKLYLKQLAQVDFDVYSPLMAYPPAFRELRVWAASCF